MRFKFGAAAVVLTWVVSVGLVGRGAQTPAASTTWSGVYTEAQAESGGAAYAKHCSECHLEDLAGDGFAPALKGPEFMNNWNTLSVGDLFERIRVSMPPSDTNAVTPKQKIDIVAFLLKSAGFPAGQSELAPTLDALKAIKFEATKPGR
jgi:S-disulfanyl-L-cysteine oxidoreductase SoxD